jgi:transposase-like protein
VKTERYTAEQVVEALKQHDGIISDSASALGCTQQTIRNYRKRYASVAQAIHDGRESLVDQAEGVICKSLDSENENTALRAAMFILKTMGKRRGWVERQEFSGVEGQPQEVVITWGEETGVGAKHGGESNEPGLRCEDRF